MKKAYFILFAFLFLAGVTHGQVKVTGKVVDTEGTPVAFATVNVKGTTQGVTTTEDGSYSISTTENATLVFSFIGYTSQEQAVNGRTVVNATLRAETASLDEVIVVAYGTVKKSTFTGAASVVGGKAIESRLISNVTQALQGASSGVQVASLSGQPGASATVRIRGVGSISASSEPLYVVDGIPFEGSSMNAINTADIESMTVLKDAAANSLYGARGSNGVVLITTKKGAKGKLMVNLDMRAGLNVRGLPAYDVVRNPGQYLELGWEALKNRAITEGVADPGLWASQHLINKDAVTGGNYGTGGYNPYGNIAADQVVLDGKLNPNARLLYQDDWMKDPFQTGFRTENVFSVSGANDQTSYYISTGYMKDESYLPSSDFERYTVRAKVDQTVNSWFKTGTNLAYTRTTTNSPWSSGSAGAYTNTFMFAQQVAPIFPIWQYNQQTGEPILDNNGQKIYDYGVTMGQRPYGSNSNPLSDLANNITKTEAGNTSALFYGEITFLKDFIFRSTINAQDTKLDNTDFQTPIAGDAKNVGGRGSRTLYNFFTVTTQNQLSWKKIIADVHDLDFIAVHESFRNEVKTVYGQKENFLIPGNPEFDNAVRINNLSSSRQRFSIESYISRLQYGYDNKYYLSASVRRDGSSRFAPESRWGTFWATGASWRMNKEAFFDFASSWLNLLKVKASFGTQGNEAMLDANGNPVYNAFQDQYEVVSQGEGEIGVSLAVRGNRQLQWEKSNNFNAGVEIQVFSRLSANFEYYNKTTSNLLYRKTLPRSMGMPTYIWDNAISMRNQGVELELSYDLVSNNDMLWIVRGNITTQANKILKLPKENDPEGKGYRYGDYFYKVGNSIYDFYLPMYAGVDPATGSPLWFYDVKDNTGNVERRGVTSIYDNATYYEVGKKALPDFYGGISTELSWKGIDCSLITSYQVGGHGFDQQYTSLMHNMSSLGNNLHMDAVNRRWTTPGQVTDVPKLEHGYAQSGTSDRFLVDRSFFSLQNLTVGYTLPKKLSEKVYIDKVRLYAAIDNIYLWSARKGYDPRTYISGSSTYSYPNMRTYSFGLNLNF